ncbi:MAG: tRNA (adenosine(37)-N6)-threonylcarbamoyltransferase complex ATPase subunit type 1 TsaE [Gammaproteobacteria bacterium]|nr:tRNA (adenosine(37)-N6)-threonylcarbamoyltransferase complex ATPase subunit type 1 TsaE [Gammaproteobacteria bacterium]MCW5583469.1 tRNA (adenosine(37)-N6)-threonylcarbamoyltransferase complex ATPase subunit type 1 TsaE [Gammaproteobacteria bacterium]
MSQFASRFAKTVNTGVIIYLQGPLGVGKTTLTRGFLRGLGYNDKVKSPSYTLVESYHVVDRTVDRTIFHFDFYRINDPRELEHIGIQEYFTANAICLIEWPEKGFPFLPEADLDCYLAFSERGREICLIARSAKGREIIGGL